MTVACGIQNVWIFETIKNYFLTFSLIGRPKQSVKCSAAHVNLTFLVMIPLSDYIGTLLVDGFCFNHVSGPAGDDGELIDSSIHVCLYYHNLCQILNLFFCL